MTQNQWRRLKDELFISTLIAMKDGNEEKLRELAVAFRMARHPNIANWLIDNLEDERVRISLT